MKRRFYTLALIVTLLFPFGLLANEGMWLPLLLKELNEKEMKMSGLKISAEDIYSVNKSSLKDAIVHFGGGCTAEVISNQGLLLTNHHCGYGQIQSHSSLEHDYLTDGFWAKNQSEELKNPGLTAMFIVRIEDVTDDILFNITDDMSPLEQAKLINQNMAGLEKKSVEGTHYGAQIKSFFYGNKYYNFITETFKDVRLVGAPPSSIGKFGGDTDNWVWPRHTGDFSMFRIYAGKDNKPAEISADNVPYEPKKALTINLSPVKEGDFTMVFGFPGSTEQYLYSDAVDYILNTGNPAKIDMRDHSLSIINTAMRSSDKTRIQYAAKQSRISNAHKKWQGQNIGLREKDALGAKKRFETRFQRVAKGENAALLRDFAKLYSAYKSDWFAREMFIEYYFYGPEIFRFAYGFKNLLQNYEKLKEEGKLDEEVEKMRKSADAFYKNYDKNVDKQVFEALTKLYLDYINAPADHHLRDISSNLYSDKNIFTNKEELYANLDKFNKGAYKKMSKDVAYTSAINLMQSFLEEINPKYLNFKAEEDVLMKKYVKAMMELFPDKKYWPDANGTLRLTYGNAEGSTPRDGMKYTFYTTLSGVMAKHNIGHDDFDMPQKLKELYMRRNYGRYGHDGELRVCFTGSNHTTGGNSGSPVLNGNGELIGLNFDRSWESTMSDLYYDGDICRNISVSINYVLFIIDKFAGAKHLIQEMDIVETSSVQSDKPKQH